MWQTISCYLTEPTDEAVGFTAYYTAYEVDYNLDDIIILDSVASNIGGYYQLSSSQFICPVNGMYAFNSCIKTGSGDNFAAY